jgi:hypothetical protein
MPNRFDEFLRRIGLGSSRQPHVRRTHLRPVVATGCGSCLDRFEAGTRSAPGSARASTPRGVDDTPGCRRQVV